MKVSTDRLVDLVYEYYPRGLLANDPQYTSSPQHQRLVAARKQAGADRAAWRGLLGRISQRFPESRLQDGSVHLPTGEMDAAYLGTAYLPTAPGEVHHTIEFRISFLVPCYMIYSSRIVEDAPKKKDPNKVTARFFYDWTPEDDLADHPPVRPGIELPEPATPTREIRSFDFSPDELPYATAIAEDIEAHWSHERMPPEVGKIVVPDVSTSSRLPGEATLYDCLMSDAW
jgi:hypothetical protein